MSYINKEAAIDLIESMIADKGVAFNPHKLAMALKEMESVEIPEAKNTDLISRQAVIDLILDAQDGSGQTYEAIRDLLHEVAYMPPVEPKPVCEDCIDRYAVLAELDPKSYEYKVVKELPSVEPKQSKGEWQITINQDYRCTNCGKITSTYKANFCPNCGADMRGD